MDVWGIPPSSAALMHVSYVMLRPHTSTISVAEETSAVVLTATAPNCGTNTACYSLNPNSMNAEKLYIDFIGL
jgi:hypothetical protein